MAEHLLQITLDDLEGQFVNQRQKAESDRQAAEIELAEINSLLSNLEQRRQDCLTILGQHDSTIESIAANYQAAQIHATANSLRSAAHSLEELRVAAKQLEDLENERQALLKLRPELNEAWQSHQANLAYLGRPQTIDDMPSELRAIVLQKVEDIKQQVAPIIALENKAKDRLASNRTIIQVIVTRDPAADFKMLWITPVLQRSIEPPAANNVALEFIRAVENAVIDLARASDWIVEKVTRQQHAGLVTLELDTFYNGERKQSLLIEDIIRQQLSISPIFQFAQSSIEVIEIPWQVWQSTYSLLQSNLSPASETLPVEEIVEEAAPVQMSHNLLFSAADIKSWSAKVAPGSEWGMAARRLRTLFMRLIAHGYVGEKSMELDSLLVGLPDIHQSDLQGVISQLVDSELIILRKPNSGAVNSISINPSGLRQIQSLVNRELSQAWRPFLTH